VTQSGSATESKIVAQRAFRLGPLRDVAGGRHAASAAAKFDDYRGGKTGDFAAFASLQGHGHVADRAFAQPARDFITLRKIRPYANLQVGAPDELVLAEAVKAAEFLVDVDKRAARHFDDRHRV
jgi:hypothetical protein